MLKILSMISPYPRNTSITPNILFIENKNFVFEVQAPLYWWVDFDGMKYGFDLSGFSKSEINQLSISTPVTAWITLPYKDIVSFCTDYRNGEYKYEDKYYQWNNEREWCDFCETLADIKGIRDLIQEDN